MWKGGISLKNLVKLRQQAGLSQQALADRFHLSQQTIHKYENGLAEPDIATLIELATFFGVSVDYLIGNDLKPLESRADLIASYTVEEQDFICEIRKLRPPMRSAFYSFLKNLSKTGA